MTSSIQFFFTLLCVAPAFSAEEQDNHNLVFWRGKYTANDSDWHYNFVHPQLLKNIELVTGQKLTAEPVTDKSVLEANGKKTWFLPLSGKSRDVSYLLSQGFKVFGVEISKEAIENMGKEQNIDLKYDEADQTYRGADGRLVIFNGDFFEGPVEKFRPVDYVWDRAAFCGLKYDLREFYVNAVKKVLRKDDGSWSDFKYLFEAWVYPKSKFEGPPRSADEEDIKQYFESWATVKFLSSEEPPIKNHPQFASVGDIGQFNRYYLFTPSK